MNNIIRGAVLLLVLASGLVRAQTEIIRDNVAPFFSVTGTWPASTAVPGYVGATYQTHEANGTPPTGIVVDNTDPGFSVTGTWTASTSVSGYLGTNYQHHFANGAPPSAIVADNSSGTFTGSWPTSTSVSGYYGTNYQTHTSGTGANVFTWPLNVASAGAYEVYARWTSHPNRASNAKYTVNHAAGANVVTVNQEQASGTWVLLGTYSFDAGNATVSLSDDANDYVIADAVMIVPPGAAPNTATWTLPVPATGSYDVYARWTAHPNRATDAKYTVNHAGGATTLTANQEANSGTWNLLGTFTFNAGNATVNLTDQANGYVIADAVMLAPPGSPPNSAIWTPNVATAGSYQVYAQWTANPNRATNATYTVTHAAGATPVAVNQQANGGVWNLLGTYSFAPGTTHKVTLTDQANGFVIADAIRLVLINTPPTVSMTAPAANAILNAPGPFTLTATAADTDGTIQKVDFFAGAILIGTATTSPYTVQWTNPAPGAYSLTAVATDNSNAATTSAAVPVTVNTVPTVAITTPSSGASFNAPATVTVTADAADADGTITKVDFYQGATLIGTVTASPYTIQWTGVTAGSYSLTAVATDNLGGTTTSTAVAISVNVAKFNYFIHADHLNTPRLVADATGTTVWRWDNQEPFGDTPPDENPSGLGTFEFPLRFPGQYADKETGNSDNWFRTYSAALGGYPQADPLGIATTWPRVPTTGLNHPYTYVASNPLSATDPRGLVKWYGWGRSFAFGAYGRDEYELESECKCGTQVRIKVIVDSFGPGKGAASTRDEAEFEDDFQCPNPMAFAGPALGFTATIAFRYGVSYSRIQIGRAVSSGWSAVEGLGASIGPSGGAADVEVISSKDCCQK